MAKKAANATIATEKVAQSRKDERVKAPCALVYFWEYANLSWKYCEQHIDRLSLTAPYLTKDYVAERLLNIKTVKELPNNSTRLSNKSRALVTVEADRQKVLSLATNLENALYIAYKATPSLVPIERKNAGINNLREATSHNWPAVSTFLTTVKNYFTANGQKLVDAKAIAADFDKLLDTAQTEFEASYNLYLALDKDAEDGTSKVATGVDDIILEIQLMQRVGKQVFEYEPDLYKLFTRDHVLAVVRSKHPAGLDGTTAMPPIEGSKKGQPLANILVEVLGVEGKSAITNKQGRYIIKQLAAGEYMVRYSGEGIGTLVQKVVLEPGISRRLDVTLEPAPVAAERTVQAPASFSLNDAVSGLLDEPMATNGVQEEAAA
jgi:Carboxypeptidase regulatory-like domain